MDKTEHEQRKAQYEAAYARSEPRPLRSGFVAIDPVWVATSLSSGQAPRSEERSIRTRAVHEQARLDRGALLYVPRLPRGVETSFLDLMTTPLPSADASLRFALRGPDRDFAALALALLTARVNLRLPVTEAAQRAGLTVRQVNALETGDDPQPFAVRDVARLAAVLHAPYLVRMTVSCKGAFA